jgi:hypothetical protein
MKKTLIAGTLVAAGLVLGAPLAHADSDKYAYLAALNKVAEPGTEDSQLNNGYVICEALNQHQDAVSVMTQVAPRANLTIDWSGYMVGAAIRYLCPEQTWQIEELHDADQSVPGVSSAILGFGP